MPGDLKVVYFVNSGSEANDLATLMARAYTGNYDLIALRNAYHGGNASAMALTSHHTWKFNVPHAFGVQHALAPDTYRGPYGRPISKPDANTPTTSRISSNSAAPGRSPASSPNRSKGWAAPSSFPTAT